MTTIAGRYELDPVHIGKGGMGEVWGATDTQLRRRVAVKFIQLPGGEPDPELVGRFMRESRLTARMDHPGVPTLHDVDKETEGPFAGRLYLVMQLIDGTGLDDLLAEHQPFPVGWAAAIAAQTCAVLHHAHGMMLVHRDLKPSNLMLDKAGGVKVLDFGLAVALDADERSRLTSSNQMLGTLAYMAPEQFQGRFSALSDLYSLGCVLYRMLSGQDPFEGPTQASLMHAHIYQDAVPVRRVRADVPPELEELLLRLLAKRPQDRPASAGEVYDLLLPHIDELPALPGAVDPGPSSPRMYASVMGRVSARRAATPAPRPPGPRPAPADDSFSLGDVARARRQAERLVRESRHDEAAHVLSRTCDRAEETLGADHPEVIGLRTDLADMLFKAGDYSEAASAFRALAQDAARREGPDADTVLRLRFQEANSHALGGATDRALDQLAGLLDDERRIYGEDDERVLELRRQIGLLLYGAGRTDSAVRTLEQLVTDLEHLHGPDHSAAKNVREIIERLNGR